MVLRCVIDGLLLPAEMRAGAPPVIVFDGDESFTMESVEALYYELVAASDDERLLVQGYYRLLRMAADFQAVAA